MKRPIHLALALLGLLSCIASAHPGHSVFDPAGVPHPGHEGEIALLLFGAFSLAGFGIHRWLDSMRG